MTTNNSIQEVVEVLNQAKCVAIFCHARPDGDALGSGLALCKALEQKGKQAALFCEDSVPERFGFLPTFLEVKHELTKDVFDLMVSVDCADVNRMGVFTDAYIKFKGKTLNIDHHISNNRYAKYNYIVECPATCELMTDILTAMKVEYTAEIANLLMTGLITDSGNFTHQDVTSKTFQVAGMLRENGADCTKIHYYMNSRQTKARAYLYGKTMSKMRFALEDRLAMITVMQSDLEREGAARNMTEGFVDFPLSIEGVEVAAAILEVKANQYKISLRSKGTVNVNAVAGTFGGGGHILASGCMLFGEYEEVIERLTYAVYQNL